MVRIRFPPPASSSHHDGVVSLGRHRLRGLATPQELFAPG